MLASIELSVRLIRKANQFEKIVFYTDSLGKELTKDLLYLYDDVIIDECNVSSKYWTVAKISIYKLQTSPFVHIDNDVYLWNGIPNDWLKNADFFFQGKESKQMFKNYDLNYNELINYSSDIFDYRPDYAINTGVIGINDISIIPEYLKKANKIIEIDNKYNLKTHDMCLTAEQFIIVPLVEKKIVKYIIDEKFKEISGVRYTHLLGSSKRNVENMLKVRNKLNELKNV
jgi:hypothetical protein